MLTGSKPGPFSCAAASSRSTCSPTRFAGNPLAVVLEPTASIPPRCRRSRANSTVPKPCSCCRRETPSIARSCASSRRRPRFLSPAIRRSARPCCSARARQQADASFVLEEQIGPVRCKVTPAEAGMRPRGVRAAAPAAGHRRGGGRCGIAAALSARRERYRIRRRPAGALVGRCALSRAAARPRAKSAQGTARTCANSRPCLPANNGRGTSCSCARDRSSRATTSTRACSRPRGHPEDPATGVRPAAFAGLHPLLRQATDGRANARDRTGLRDGPAEPDRTHADDRRWKLTVPRSAAAPSLSKARSRLDRGPRAPPRISRSIRLDLCFEPVPWQFAIEQPQAEIDAYFAELQTAKPEMWNGRVLLLQRARDAEGVFRRRLSRNGLCEFYRLAALGFAACRRARLFRCRRCHFGRRRRAARRDGAAHRECRQIYFPAARPIRAILSVTRSILPGASHAN